MDQTEQITRQTGLVPDMRTIGLPEDRHRFSTACEIEWVSSICLQDEPPGLEQEPVWCQQDQLERLQARQAGPLALMQQRILLVWELRAAWEEQVSPA